MRFPLRAVPIAIHLGLLGAAASPAARACIWDRDTLATEQLRFPGVLDIVTGAFPRHSFEYHEWRAAGVGNQLTSLSDSDPRGLALRDDLAVPS